MSDIEFARDLVPDRYSALPILRLFLPLIGANNRAQRWSSFLSDGIELTGSIEWAEVWDLYAASAAVATAPPIPARGHLDGLTARALTDALVLQMTMDAVLHCRIWEGYSDVHDTPDSPAVRQFGHDFLRSDLTVQQMVRTATSDRIPEFGNDDSGFFAWGTNLYPDSLIIASAGPIYRTLISDPRLDTVTIRKESDRLPVSSGD
jgi:hypothetical protein